MSVYFKIVPANAADAVRLQWILTNKKFYPEVGSTPALPIAYDGTFDYRQFLIVKNQLTDGSYIVKTRSEYTTIQFGVNVVPTADWTARYYLSIAPTITVVDFSEVLPDGHSRVTNGVDTFLSYDYNLYNNK